MLRNLGVGILILCFSLSSVNVGLAYEVIDVSPVIVQPYDVGTMDLQMFEMDRENQEKVAAIKALVKENQKLADAAVAPKQNATFEKINKTIANSQYVSKYDELINLTEDADDMTSAVYTVALKRDVIEEKYKTLTDLENEMMALNKKLNGAAGNENPGNMNHQQEDNIQIITQRLGEMDQKIVHYNDVLAGKDQQIAQLVDNLAKVQSEAKTKDDTIQKQKSQVDLLKSELENKITETNSQTGSIHWLNQVLVVTKNEAKYYKLTSQQNDLAVQQVQKELRDMKDDFARHSKDYDHFEDTIASFKNQVSELSLQLSQKQAQVDLLKLELKNKIAEGNDQGVLTDQVQDLKSQLQDKEDQLTAMKAKIQAGQDTKQVTDSLTQQLAAQQDKVDQLKQQLDIKTAQSDQMSLMMDEYQKKLESRNNAYNEQMGQVMSSKNDQAQMEKQVVDLSARLQEKEAQLIKIKKDMYDLQELNRDSQTKDLNSSLTQQKMLDKKINEYQEKINGLQALSATPQGQEIARLKAQLALERQGLNGIANSDELNFLRTAYRQASADLEQKDKMYHESKANADEYEKEFKAQTREFQSVKEQLQDAQDEIKRKNEDLRYRGLEIIRLKELSRNSEEDLKTQVWTLTRKLEAADKGFVSNPHENKVQALQAQLKREDLEIKDLQAQLDQFQSPSNHDALEGKLTQALSKIDEQGQTINLLTQKLQEGGQSAGTSK